jgi:hypothetical protein
MPCHQGDTVWGLGEDNVKVLSLSRERGKKYTLARLSKTMMLDVGILLKHIYGCCHFHFKQNQRSHKKTYIYWMQDKHEYGKCRMVYKGKAAL